MVEHQGRDLEVRARVLVQVQIFLLKFKNDIIHNPFWDHMERKVLKYG